MKINGYILGISGIMLLAISLMTITWIGLSNTEVVSYNKIATYGTIPILVCWMAWTRGVMKKFTKRDYLTNFDVVILLWPIIPAILFLLS